MKLLAIDCASSMLSVAVSNGDSIYYSQIESEMKQSEFIMECIDNQMKEAALNPNEINGVLCMGGPGSFTGLRIGYSIAKGLALSLSIPFAPVPTLDCIAYGNTDVNITLAVTGARKLSYFYSFFRNAERITGDSEADCAEIIKEIEQYTENIVLTGPNSASLYESLPLNLKNKIIPKLENRGYAKELIYIAKEKKILENDCTIYLNSGPEYIRDSI